MNPVERQKICPHCEARIAVDSNSCPYCAADQDFDQEKMKNSFNSPLFETQSLQDSLHSLYQPPYSGKKSPFEEEPVKIVQEQPMKAQVAKEPIYSDSSNYMQEELKKFAPQAGVKSSLWPTILVISGSNLLIWGFIQLFFSQENILKLEWDSSYWFFYCLLAAPLLFFGLKKTKELE
ncbi:MAG: hypothetical protein L0207_01215 [Chlamydiae bacterium]|nr:hypothetical protein [Chlamydiota bacterium]